MIDLNIVAFDVPYPANYGGVIDVFYKLEALKEQGLKVALHCFDYGRGRSSELQEVAEEVHYYNRKTSWFAAAFTHPYTVKSRENRQLLENLKKNSSPILFESLLSCAFLNHSELADRKKYVRTHNVEHNYYDGLATYEGSRWKQLYFQKEARALEHFEPILKNADGLFCISPKDEKYFKKYKSPTFYLPAFSNETKLANAVVEEFALYHGNLSVEENKAAVDFLISVFKELPIKFVIAGRDPSQKLKTTIKQFKNIELIENPTDTKMEQLVSTAKVNCLPTFQSTGIKLKLLNALKNGNEVLVNPLMVEETGLENYCKIAENEMEWKSKIDLIYSGKLNRSIIENRQTEVRELFNNRKNAKQLVEWLGLVQ